MDVVSPAGGTKELSLAKRRLLERRLRGVAGVLKDGITPRLAGVRVPASAEQYRIWLHAAMEPELPIYNESITVHRYGSFHLEALEEAFNEVLRRHEIWRTNFKMEEQELVQVIRPAQHVSLKVTDLRGWVDGDAEARRLASEDAAVAFDLAGGALVRARVVRVGEAHHWLQMTLHHIVFDGVSIYRVFLPELAALYAAFDEGRESPLAVPSLQYGDYAVWHKGQLEMRGVGAHLEYWKGELTGEIPVLRLPLDRARPAVLRHRGAMECFNFPEELTEGLHALGRTHGATLYMVLLAGLKALFFRYSGQEDVIVGGLADGRRRPELEGLMGYFLQTFALRTRPAAEVSFVAYLREVKRSVLGALAAAEVPFDHVVQALRPQRDQSHHPLFQTFLAVQPEVGELPAGWDVSKTEVAVQATKFDLYIEVDERAGQLRARLMYSTDLFDAATIRRLAGHWVNLLHGVVVMPECALGDLPLLSRKEQETMLVAWNETAKEFPALAVHELVEAQARRTPDTLAVEFGGEGWTYAELDSRVETLAGRLRYAGAGVGDLVAVCLERGLPLLCALLAVLKTGAAYLPLDPDTPMARKALCLEDAEPCLIVTQRSLANQLPNGGAERIFVDDDGAGSTVRDCVRLESTAYVIHTSGSTGRPKGVEVSHHSLVNLLLSMKDRPGFAATDVLLAVTTISFDIAGLEMFLPLVCGGRVVIASRQIALDPYLLATAIEECGCTVMQATPATWRGLLASGWEGRKGLRVLCGGEALPRDLAEGLLTLGLEVWNVYGPTETTIWSTVERVTRGVGPVSVGRPIANTSAYILDERQQVVPVGVQGELYLGGAGVAIGYRGQPKLTAEKFVRSPFNDGQRLYRTGDYAIYRADGRIEIQGRSDNQVKVRGYRIELEDVEAAVCAHPRVAAGAAKVWPDATGGNRLSVYVVGPVEAAELREFLRGRVPEYMVPSDVVVLETMPLTANGKLDRMALTRPVSRTESVVDVGLVTEDERRLAAIWTELLGAGSVGTHDNFFDLGGHSLLVARLQMRIAEAFGRKVAMAALFHVPTLAGQIALLHRVDESVDSARLLAIQPHGRRQHLFWIEPPPLIGNLANGLGLDQPLLGVTMTADDLAKLGEEPTLEEMAACYAQTIVRAQACGPYLLGGLCVGGILAYEVAVQLVQGGHVVSSVVMLDSENPVFYRRLHTAYVEFGKLRFYAKRAFATRGLAMFVRHMRSRVRRLFGAELTVATEMSEVENAVLQSALRYHPPVYGGDVLLVLPGDRPDVVDYRSGWNGIVTGTLTCVDVNSHHDELLRVGNVGGVAAALLDHFDGITES